MNEAMVVMSDTAMVTSEEVNRKNELVTVDVMPQGDRAMASATIAHSIEEIGENINAQYKPVIGYSLAVEDVI
jgi:hypothetical protein